MNNSAKMSPFAPIPINLLTVPTAQRVEKFSPFAQGLRLNLTKCLYTLLLVRCTQDTSDLVEQKGEGVENRRGALALHTVADRRQKTADVHLQIGLLCCFP